MNVVIVAAIQTNEWQEVNWWFLVVHPQGLINCRIIMHTIVLLDAHTVCSHGMLKSVRVHFAYGSDGRSFFVEYS